MRITGRLLPDSEAGMIGRDLPSREDTCAGEEPLVRPDYVSAIILT